MMRNRLESLFIICSLCSCCVEHDDLAVAVENENVVMEQLPFFYDGQDVSRVSITNTGTSLKFGWEVDDKVGLFSLDKDNPLQGAYVFNSSADGTSLVLSDREWKWYMGTEYVAYYPYNADLDGAKSYIAVPVDMTGQRQRSNASAAHIGKSYNYLYSSGRVDTGGNLKLDFKHVCGIVILDLKMPKDIIWKNVTLTSQLGEVFTTTATMNALTGEVTGKTTSASVSLDLEDIKGDELTLYMAMLPVTTGDVSLSVTTATGRVYNATLPTKTIKAGRAYKWTASPVTVFDYGTAPKNVKAVDLGLPSGLLWANMNLGATYEAGKGYYFAWGEVAEQASNAYRWSTYKFTQNGAWTGISKYTYPDGQTTGAWYRNGEFIGDGLTTLLPEDDAAHEYWQGDWRMPTNEEMKELVDNTTAKWSNNYGGYGIPGLVVTSKINGEVVFFSTSGGKWDGSARSTGSRSYFWSSSLCTTGRGTAYSLNLTSSGIKAGNSSNRYYGYSVRAVM